MAPTTSVSASERSRRSAAERRRNQPSVGRYIESFADGGVPRREIETLDARTRAIERVMLGLRLDEPFALDAFDRQDGVVDADALERLVDGQLVERVDGGIRLTPRGRLLGGAVTAELLS